MRDARSISTSKEEWGGPDHTFYYRHYRAVNSSRKTARAEDENADFQNRTHRIYIQEEGNSAAQYLVN